MPDSDVAERTVGETAVAAYRAYADHDRAAIERLIADDFSFTSPLDNAIDRRTYFERCWPNNRQFASVDFVRVVENGPEAIVTYEVHTVDKRTFRNTEVVTVADGQIGKVEVYFGWSIPHEAPAGGFVNKS